MTKLEKLKENVREWNETRSIALAFEICASLFNNLDMEKDSEPKKPLIPDELACKAVAAWAIAEGHDVFTISNRHYNCCVITGIRLGVGTSSQIELGITIPGAKKGRRYTLTELCGAGE